MRVGKIFVETLHGGLANIGFAMKKGKTKVFLES